MQDQGSDPGRGRGRGILPPPNERLAPKTRRVASAWLARGLALGVSSEGKEDIAVSWGG